MSRFDLIHSHWIVCAELVFVPLVQGLVLLQKHWQLVKRLSA